MNKTKKIYMTTDIKNTVDNAAQIKPKKLFLKDLKWRYLVRSALRGKNILIIGPSGSGKTFAVQSLVDALDIRDKYFYINMGATQDPRAALIGNTHFNKESGTLFDESPFVKALRTPNSIIHLDELSRAHPDAWNILLTPLDYIQRYLRLDEKLGSEKVQVAEGVCFVATANVGNEYTATRVMDKALLDSFTVKIEMDILNQNSEIEFIKEHCPNADMNIMLSIVEIAAATREFTHQGKLSKFLSTRSVKEMAELTIDGFNLIELAEMIIYPDYPDDGGVDSERTMVKQIVQKYVAAEGKSDALYGNQNTNRYADQPPF
jgi:MoxR-like ATPase